MMDRIRFKIRMWLKVNLLYKFFGGGGRTKRFDLFEFESSWWNGWSQGVKILDLSFHAVYFFRHDGFSQRQGRSSIARVSQKSACFTRARRSRDLRPRTLHEMWRNPRFSFIFPSASFVFYFASFFCFVFRSVWMTWRSSEKITYFLG